MKKIFALFDDPDGLQRARRALDQDGHGDEVVDVVHGEQGPGSEAESATTLVDPGLSTSGPVVVNRIGQAAPRGTADDLAASLGRLDLPADEREHFERVLGRGSAQVLVLEVESSVQAERVQLLEDHGAQYVTSR